MSVKLNIKGNFAWIEDDKTACCTYCSNSSQLEHDFGSEILKGKKVVYRPPLYQITIRKYRHKAKIMQERGLANINTEKIDMAYTFNGTLLYDMALSIAKRYRDMVKGGWIKVCTDKVCHLHKEWAFVVYDYRGMRQYVIYTSCVPTLVFQPIFKKVL